MKKMTAKEFKQVFEECGFSLEIYGYEGILSMLCHHEAVERDEFEKLGLHAGARACEQRRRKLYQALDARKYFE